MNAITERLQKNCQRRILYPAKMPFRNQGCMKILHKQKWVNSWPADKKHQPQPEAKGMCSRQKHRLKGATVTSGVTVWPTETVLMFRAIFSFLGVFNTNRSVIHDSKSSKVRQDGGVMLVPTLPDGSWHNMVILWGVSLVCTDYCVWETPEQRAPGCVHGRGLWKTLQTLTVMCWKTCESGCSII